MLCSAAAVAGQAVCRTIVLSYLLSLPLPYLPAAGEWRARLCELQEMGQAHMQCPAGNWFFIKVYFKLSFAVLSVRLCSALGPSFHCFYAHSHWILLMSLPRWPGCSHRGTHRGRLWPLRCGFLLLEES